MRLKRGFVIALCLAALAAATAEAAPIHQAAQRGDVKQLTALLKAKPELLNARDELAGGTPLHYAAANGRAKAVALLLSEGALVDARNATGDTSLVLAVASAAGVPAAGAPTREDYRTVVAALVAAGADTEARNWEDRTPLHEAAQVGDAKLVAFLCEHGAGREARDNEQNTPLLLAAQEGKSDAARMLLARGAAVMARNRQGETALHLGAWYGSVPVVLLVLEYGADLQARDNGQCTALDRAAMRDAEVVVSVLRSREKEPVREPQDLVCLGQVEALKEVLARAPEMQSADEDTRQSYLGWLLTLAANAGQPGVVAALLELGAEANAGDPEGDACLHLAAMGWRRGGEVVKLLLAHGGLPDAANGEGETPLMVAVRFGNRGAAAALLAGGADPEIRDRKGRTAMFTAVETDHATLLRRKEGAAHVRRASEPIVDPGGRLMIEVLASADADVDARADEGLTPLHEAAALGNQEVAAVLLSLGANPNAKTQQGRTPLYYVVTGEGRSAGRLQIAKSLLANGARREMTDNRGKTPCDYARTMGDAALAKLLSPPEADTEQGESE